MYAVSTTATNVAVPKIAKYFVLSKRRSVDACLDTITCSFDSKPREQLHYTTVHVRGKLIRKPKLKRINRGGNRVGLYPRPVWRYV
jgi:hypothetical protein